MATREGTKDVEVTRPPDASVQRLLVENHRAFLSFLERRLGQRELAEDLLQEAFARALPKVEALRDDEALTAWFDRTLRNAVIDHSRRTEVADRALERFVTELEAHEDPPVLVRDGACRCVLRLVDSMRPNYAQALQRIEVDGISVKDFAAEQGISDNNAAARISRARKALRAQLTVSCGTCAEQDCLDCTCSHAPVGEEPMER